MQKLRGLDLVGTSVDGALIALKGNKVVREECLYAARPARRSSWPSCVSAFLPHDLVALEG